MIRSTILALLFVPSFCCCQSVEELPLRKDPLEVVIADLQSFIPLQMQSNKVLGLSVAFIQEGSIAWAQGFGRSNSITRSPVTPQTVFSVASNGKSVSAYGALQLVSTKQLSLDRPLHEYLNEKWLPNKEWHNRINLHHVLSHSSGLSNFLRDETKALEFEPGTWFSYSGLGFMYMQEAMEAVSEKTLDGVLQETTFGPLKMKHSYFSSENRPADADEARGHIKLLRALAPFSIIFLPSFFILVFLSWLLIGFLKKSWRLIYQIVLVAAFIPALGTYIFLFMKAGGHIMAFYFSMLFWGFVMVWISLSWLAQKMFLRWRNAENKTHSWKRRAASIISLLVLGLLLGLSHDCWVPAPDWFPRKGNAASSLRSTSGDLANFMIELGKGQFLKAELLEEMTNSQIAVHEHVSWGLGVGIQHSDQGDCLWHWGSNPGSKSLMVYYPKQATGIVILTNSENGFDIIDDIAARALGGKAYWNISGPE